MESPRESGIELHGSISHGVSYVGIVGTIVEKETEKGIGTTHRRNKKFQINIIKNIQGNHKV